MSEVNTQAVMARDLARKFAARFPQLGSRVSAELECELAVDLAWLIGEREGHRQRADAAENRVQELAGRLASREEEAQILRRWWELARERVVELEDDVAGLQKRLDAANSGS